MHLSWPSLYPTFTWSNFHYLIFMSCHCFQAHSTSLDFMAKVSTFRLLLVISLLVHSLTACAVIRGLNGQDLRFSSASLPCMEKAMAPHPSTLAWRIPRTEEPGGLQSMGWQGVRHDWLKQLSSSSSSSYLYKLYNFGQIKYPFSETVALTTRRDIIVIVSLLDWCFWRRDLKKFWKEGVSR